MTDQLNDQQTDQTISQSRANQPPSWDLAEAGASAEAGAGAGAGAELSNFSQ